MTEFAHLHVHTEFSLLDGMGRIDEYVRRCKDLGMQHMAVTDHGVMYAAMDWHNAGKKAGLHPIIGMEAYLSEGPAAQKQRRSYHLLLLAENEVGYRNLIKLASRASLEGFYYNPRIDLEMLQQHHEGIIATSACLGGPVAKPFLEGDDAKARQYAATLAEIFGPERFYIEIQDHGIPEQIQTNRKLIPLARSLNLPIVATNDVHYCHNGDAPFQDVLVCVQTNTTVHDPKRLKQDSQQFFLKGPDEMARLFGEVPESLSNTMRIAEMCNVDLGFKGYALPEFPCPDGLSPDDYLHQLCRQGTLERYGHLDGAIGERLDYELGVISRMGFANYFLVVWDFVRFAKEQGILVGPGRGSAAGSLVTYSLGITALDPLKYDLIFERFLNPSRISMPDIDIDFADDRRSEVIDYVVQKYGSDHVAQIVTFGTMAAKGSMRDVGRALGMPLSDVDRVAKLIPVGPGVTIAGSLEKVPELQAIYDSEPQLRDLIDTAKKVEGIARHSSTHAAGVVISRDPLVQHVPLQRAGGKSEGEITTQYTMGHLEAIGLLKMDFLGLRTLTVVGRAVELAKRKDPTLTIESIPMDDPRAYEMLCRGETAGIFQLEGGMTTRMTVDVAPQSFEDLIALMALIRPGPMEMAPDYIARKHGRTEIVYQHPDMEPVLAETYGVALYQEQVMRLANVLSGFTMAEADGLRKAMGKKLPEEMAKYRGRFVEGALAHGLDKGLAGDIYDTIEKFAGYGFNKAHSAAYAVIAAQTAYLKANYPVEFMAALCTAEMGNTDRVVSNLVECRRAGIAVLPPDVNRSELVFTVEAAEDGAEVIRMGLGAVKNLGVGAIAAIVEARGKQPGGRFADLETLCAEIDWQVVNRRAVEAMAKSGALDGFGPRSWVINSLDKAIANGQQQQKAAARGQTSLFDMFGGGDVAAVPALAKEDPKPLPRRDLLTWEKEHLGIYLSDHPLKDVFDRVSQRGVSQVVELQEREPGGTVTLIGMITSVRRITTKKNTTMAIVVLEDLTGTIEVVLFPEAYDASSALLEVDRIVQVGGKLERRGEQLQVVSGTFTDELPEIERARGPEPTVHIRVPVSDTYFTDLDLLQALQRILREHEGDDAVVLHLVSGDEVVRLRSRTLRVEWSAALQAEVAALLGADAAVRQEPLLAS